MTPFFKIRAYFILSEKYFLAKKMPMTEASIYQTIGHCLCSSLKQVTLLLLTVPNAKLTNFPNWAKLKNSTTVKYCSTAFQ